MPRLGTAREVGDEGRLVPDERSGLGKVATGPAGSDDIAVSGEGPHVGRSGRRRRRLASRGR